MNKREYASAFLAVLVSLTVMSSAKAEVFESTYSVTQSQGDYELITDMLVGPGVALRPSGHMIDQTEPFQIGIFSNLVAQVIPSFTNGVILSNGIITDGPSLENAYPAKEWDDEGISLQPCSDRDINEYFKEDLLVNDLYDPAGLVLYIQPKNKTINIPFVMASEEFYLGSYVPDSPSQEAYEDWSDKFAFFLQELGTASECLDAEGNVTASAMQKSNEMLMTNNIARLPGGGDVEIASVNQHTNSEYFISNVELKGEVLEYPGTNINLPMEFNGAIVGPVAVAEGLDTNKVYKLKIMLADYGDNTLTSVVFLRDRGISSGADLKIGVTGPAYLDNYGTVTFTNAVSNIGPATADGVVVTNYLPVGANYISCEKNAGEVTGPVLIGGTNCLVWTIGDRFQHGSNAVMTVKCDLPVTGFYTNSAVVVTTTGDYDERNNADEWIAQVGGDIQNITVCAISTNMAYGSTLAIPSLQFIKSIVGTNGTDAVTGVDVNFYDGEELVQPSTATVGTYRIVLSNIKGGGILPSANVTYVDGLLTVTQRVLTIIANSTNRVYGSTLSFHGTEFTTEPAELPNGETVTNVKITSKDGVAGSAKSSAGEYPGNIIPSHVVSGDNGFKTNNYDIVFSNGTLTVDKREIEITPKNRSKVYGKSYTFAGVAKEVDITKGSLASGDKITTVKLKSAATAKTAPAGTYEITASNAAISSGAANYTIAYAKGKFLVTKSDLTIIANSTNKVYGTRIDFTGKEFTTDPATLPNGDTVTNVTITSEMATNLTAEVGVYTNEIVPSHAVWGNIDTNNYDIVFSNGTLTVTKAPLTIIADGTNRVYGTTVGFTGREFTTKPLALPNNEKVDTVTITSTYAGVPTAAAGTYLEDIVPSHVVTGSFGFKTNNYDIVFSNGTLTVIKAPLTIIANSTNKVFGTEVQLDGTEFTTKPVTLPNSETVTNVTLTCPQTTNLLAAVGAYPIVPSHTVWGEDFNTNNYAIVFSNGTLKVTQADLTVIANDTNKVYNTTITFAGNEFTTLPATLPEGVAVNSVTLTSAKAASAATAAGTYKNEIVPSAAQGTGLDNYKIAYSNGTLKVTQAALTVIANDASKVYNTVKTFTGTEFTTLPATLPNGDAVTSVTLTSAKAANALTDVGTYVKEIQPSAAQGNGLENYAIVYSNGTLKVTKAALTVIANDTNKVYNTTITFAGNEFTTLPATLPTGVAVNAVTLTSEKAANAATAVGTYKGEIVPSDAIGTKLDNYAIAYSNGTLKVTKAALTVIANDTNKVYNTTITFAGNEFTTIPATLPNGDGVSSVTLTSAKAESAATAAGTYKNEVVPSAAQGTGLDNYKIAYSNGTLKVTQAALTVIANDASKVYNTVKTFTGTEFTTLPATLPNGDAVTSVTLTSAKAADALTDVGTYVKEIQPSAAVGTGLGNYAITYSNGTLTVTKAGLTVIANDASKVYNTVKTFTGKEFATLPATLPAGVTVNSVTLTSAKAADAATAAGTYKNEIVPSDAVGNKLNNYNIAYSNGTLTVTKAALTVIANSASKAYGTVKTFTGKEFTTLPATLPEGVAVNSVTLTSEKATSAATAAGMYKNEIVPSAAQGTGLGNYSITYSKGTLTVTKVPLTIIADDKSRVYGSTLAFTGKEFKTLPTALPNGDKVATVTITSAKGKDASTVVGTYPKAIVPSHIVTGINTNNYDITFSNGTLKVTQAALTVRVNDAKWNIKKPKPPYSFADFSSQLKGGDSVASVAGSAGQSQSDYTNKVWATAVPVKGDEGVYTDEIWIKLTSFNGPRASNYLITVDPGDLTVDTALPDLKIDLSWALSGDTGLLWPIMTVENVGDGEVESDSNYWVELKPVDSPKCSLWSKTGTMPDGCDYQDLTATVKAALKKIGNKDEAFDPGEKLTFDPTSKADAYPYVRVSEKSPQDLGVRVYHVNRKNPLAPPITPNMFFIAGQLFNVADTTHDFKVSDAEKTAAAAILGTSSADYLEVTRLNLLQYYHWNTAAGTWIGPSK